MKKLFGGLFKSIVGIQRNFRKILRKRKELAETAGTNVLIALKN
jgi:hypothetical protein